jgi:hypothetical protein
MSEHEMGDRSVTITLMQLIHLIVWIFLQSALWKTSLFQIF